MISLAKPVLLIGFKSVGKTSVGRELSKRTNYSFVDLDEAIESVFERENRIKSTCREIMHAHGEPYFRDLEKRVLVQMCASGEGGVNIVNPSSKDKKCDKKDNKSTSMLSNNADSPESSKISPETLAQMTHALPSIISLGGGAPMKEDNQNVIKDQNVIHLIADRDVVFNRMMMNGVPAFFSSEEPPRVYFNRLWDKRVGIYRQLATFTIHNNGSIPSVVDQIIELIKGKMIL